MIRGIALDDESPALRVLTAFCQQNEAIVLLKTFTKLSETTQFLNENTVDLLFLDINMPNITGLDFYKNIEQKIPVIFTTAYSEFAIDGFNLDAVDYLLKPYTYERFEQAVSKASTLITAKNSKATPPQFLTIRADYTLYKIAFSDIFMVQALDDYVRIYTLNSKPIVTRMTMKSILEKLPISDFKRVHKSYIVAHKYIDFVRNKTIFIQGFEVPISNSYVSDLMKIYHI